MNKFVNAIRNETTVTSTANGAKTYSTSLDAIVDMFFHLPAKRGYAVGQITKFVKPAFEQDPELAFRVALYIRDAREGAGERRTFRIILDWLQENGYRDYVGRAIPALVELGRFDDIYYLIENEKDEEIARYATYVTCHYLLEAKNGLAAKWMPRKGKVFARVRDMLQMRTGDFRRFIVSLTNVVEQKMCAKEWDQINYSHVPSVAMTRYMKAFSRNDGARFGEYVNRVRSGEVNPETGKVEKMNAGAIFPYEVLRMNGLAQDTMWNSLPDYVPEDLSFLPIIDTSGSMTCPAGGYGSNSGFSCMDVAVTLGMYLAERNKAAFKNLWLNFSTQPTWQEIKGETFEQKWRNIDRHNWSGSTNLNAALEMILTTAKYHKVPQSDMPNYLLILSDMEFNHHGFHTTAGEMIKRKYHEAGYQVPTIVWWNIHSHASTTPVRANEHGMALVSGFSPTIVKNLLTGEVTPVNIMLNTVNVERYTKW